MRFYLFKPKAVGYEHVMLMSTYEPTKVEKDNGDVHFTTDRPAVRVTPHVLAGLQVSPGDIPEPGECKKVHLRQEGDEGTTGAYFDKLFERQ